MEMCNVCMCYIIHEGWIHNGYVHPPRYICTYICEAKVGIVTTLHLYARICTDKSAVQLLTTYPKALVHPSLHKFGRVCTRHDTTLETKPPLLLLGYSSSIIVVCCTTYKYIHRTVPYRTNQKAIKYVPQTIPPSSSEKQSKRPSVN